ncbi:MAG: pyruvate dehydrogenase complex E1 component subunit beta, partial [Pelagibacteraceae bacterium]|nr:pyruvate dehydrogenase complex E1 component subunit beta [Pelagibacteraceae bacterium]
MKITLPALSPTMETGNLVKWLVKENDIVKSGEVIAEIETDKATMEIESPEDGIITKIIIKENTENVKVNTLIALLKVEGEDDSVDEINNEEKINSIEKKEQTKNSLDFTKEFKVQFTDNSSTNSNKKWKEKEITMREALNSAISEEMENDKDIFLLGEEVAEYDGAYKVTQDLLKKFGNK